MNDTNPPATDGTLSPSALSVCPGVPTVTVNDARGKVEAMRARHNPHLEAIFPDDGTYTETIREACGCSRAKAERIAEAYFTGSGLELASVDTLVQLGLTVSQAKRLNASFRLVRLAERRSAGRGRSHQIAEPSDAVDFVKDVMGRWEKESFVAIFLNSRQRVIEAVIISTGSLSQVDVHPRELFRDAIRMGVHAMVLVHNHPSGDNEPSQADLDLTARMREAGKLVGIPVLDHIVVARTPHGGVQGYSLAAAGLIR